MDIQYLLLYLLIINIITFIAFGLDKLFAIKHTRRISNSTLLGLSFIGGSIGGLIGMNLFHHKTNKKYYTMVLPVFLIIHVIIVMYLLFSGTI